MNAACTCGALLNPDKDASSAALRTWGADRGERTVFTGLALADAARLSEVRPIFLDALEERNAAMSSTLGAGGGVWVSPHKDERLVPVGRRDRGASRGSQPTWASRWV